MKNTFRAGRALTSLCLILVLSMMSATSLAQSRKQFLVDYVNPLIGTTGQHPTEYGGRIPAVLTPFGMTQWSAMTRENHIGACPYHYDDSEIIGFIGTHQPSIWMGDYGYLSFMPQTGEIHFSKEERGMTYDHQDEVAHPYYYSVTMGKGENQIRTEHTATTRCGYFHFIYPAEQPAHLTIEMSRLIGYDGYLRIIPEERKIIGYNSDHQNKFWGKCMGPELQHFKGWFVMEFDTDFDVYGTYGQDEGKFIANPMQTERQGEQIGAYITFRKNVQEVEMKVASSFISAEQAEKNLEDEMKGWNFRKTMKKCRNAWEKRLSSIQVEGGTEDQKVLFYTCLCNSLMYPSLFSEEGHYYSPFDEKIHEGVSYNAYSLWDTFRALHPLLILIAEDQVGPMITSLLQMYEEGGWIPKWPNPTYSNIMIGTHSDAVIADACVKGVEGFDLEKAYEAIYKNAMTPPDGDEQTQWADRQPWKAYEGRAGLTYYKKLGYVPADKTKESVSRTLEFAYDDFCVAQVAKKLGKEEDYQYFMDRSRYYKNLYNEESGFMHARLSNGQFAEDIKMNRAFTEGSPWTYLFCAMQDIPGLVHLLGGKEAFIQKLDQNFAENHYRHDNEPGHHYAYLYDYVGVPEKTQALVPEILKKHYANRPDGLSGNDDCGQMSAWYVFSAMGFYPVCPGSTRYALGIPMFDEIQIRLSQGRKFRISKQKTGTKWEVSLDGKTLEEPFLEHEALFRQRHLEFKN